MPLPVPWTTSCAVGSEWTQRFTFPTTDISTYTWELVLRTDATQSGTPAAKITQTAGADGYITVDTLNGYVTAVLSPTATAALTPDQTYAISLWSDVDLADQTCWARGAFTALSTAQP